MGESQKYDPSSIVCGDTDSEAEHDGENKLDQDAEGAADRDDGAAGNIDRHVDDVTGGADGTLDYTGATESVAASPRAGNQDGSPLVAFKSPQIRGAVVRDVVAAAGAAKAALSNAIKGPVVSSPSVTSSSSGHSGKSNFDVVYAKCSENKVQSMKEIQTSKSNCALLQQAREHHFQSQKIIIEAQGAEEDRKVRQKIEFEKNVATLFVQDSSGGLARSYMALLREHERALHGAAASNSGLIDRFASQFGRPDLT